MTWVAGALLLVASWAAYGRGSTLGGAALAVLAILVLMGAAAERDRRV